MKSALLLLLPLAASAQELRVYTEFARLTETGKVLAPESPREVLSPAVARNAYTSFQIVAEAPDGMKTWLYIGLNPDNAVQVNIYKETGGKLESIKLPYQATGTQVYWMDVFTDGDAPVRRIKVEPQMNYPTKEGGDDWIIYPMEARVMDARVPEAELPKGPLCGGNAEAPPQTIAAMRLRNARQDAALASLAVKDELAKLTNSCVAPPAENPEWYLPIRDYLFRLR